jgi:SAM-dependent methyltransferase
MTVRMASAGLEVERPYTLGEHRQLATRLRRFWGRVIADQDALLADLIVGQRVLEVGCGYGALVAHFRQRGIAAVGIDTDVLGLRAGREVVGPVPILAADADDLPFRDQTFDCVVFRDAWHHFDAKRALGMVRRVSKGRLVILDPNVTPVLRLARWIIGHVDEEAPVQETLDILARDEWTIERVLYRDVLALPLSGAYIDAELVPPFPALQGLLLRLDTLAGRLLNALGIARWICFRYVVVARAPEGG